jgi:hypothetical protein
METSSRTYGIDERFQHFSWKKLKVAEKRIIMKENILFREVGCSVGWSVALSADRYISRSAGWLCFAELDCRRYVA